MLLSRSGAFALRLSTCIILFQSTAFAQMSSSVTLSVSPNPSNYGQAITLTAGVTPGATGKVTFYDGTTVLGVGGISGAQSQMTTVMLPSGSRRLRAYYSGDVA